MQIVSLGDNLHVIAYFPETNKIKIQNVVCWKDYPSMLSFNSWPAE